MVEPEDNSSRHDSRGSSAFRRSRWVVQMITKASQVQMHGPGSMIVKNGPEFTVQKVLMDDPDLSVQQQ